MTHCCGARMHTAGASRHIPDPLHSTTGLGVQVTEHGSMDPTTEKHQPPYQLVSLQVLSAKLPSFPPDFKSLNCNAGKQEEERLVRQIRKPMQMGSLHLF